MGKSIVAKINVLSATIGIPASILALYLWLYEGQPNYSVEIIADTEILEVKENINELKIFYEDEDIKKLEKTISIQLIEIKNNGEKIIRINDYDAKLPPTLHIENGRILKAETINQSSEYLKKTTQISPHSESIIALPLIILEPKESFTVKAIILHSEDRKARISATGKIAGIKKISVTHKN